MAIHVDVLQQLAGDRPGHRHAARGVGVEIEIQAGVTVHTLIPLGGSAHGLEVEPLYDVVNLRREHSGGGDVLVRGLK